MINKNAIILAAGKSGKLAPFTYEKPKGMFKVKDEILIERQIQQLKDAGVNEIYVVVGYMKEKFFYLEQKYGVKLIVNNEFSEKGNLYSLFVARKYLNNTFICCADHYFVHNPFIMKNEENISYRAVSYQQGKFREFGIECSDADVITNCCVGGKDSLAMVGHAYVNSRFSQKLCELMEKEINDFGVASMFWEEFYSRHIRELTFYKKEFPSDDILEFENIDDLRAFDADFLMNVDSEIISNICKTLDCNPNDIMDISIIKAGLTNVSFAFLCNKNKYVYRHPGGTAGNLIDRDSELYAQTVAKKLGIDKSYIHMNTDGWKISHYVEDAKNCDFESSDEQLKIGMDYLHKLHHEDINRDVRVFDNVEEGKRLMVIASATKGNLQKEFEDVVKKVEKLYLYVKEDATRLGYGLVLCHNDVYEPNYLFDREGKLYLIDWEYAGLNYAANDICTILCRYDWTDRQIERYLRAFVGRELTDEEHRYYMAFIPISAFYWFCWGLYKGSVGDDDSFFFLPSYRNLIRFIDRAIDSYEMADKEM